MSEKKNILCLGGSRNQTSQLHHIARHLETDYDVYYSQIFGEGFQSRFDEEETDY